MTISSSEAPNKLRLLVFEAEAEHTGPEAGACTKFCRMAAGLLAVVMLVCGIPAKDASDRWPSFRGSNAAGVADGQDLPERWDGTSGQNIKWKVPIPGLAHSSPVVWGDRIYVTTAISGRGEATFKHGLFGAGDASDDRSSHQWKVYSIHRDTGKTVWERIAFEGAPREKRHVKGTYANSTPATDGAHVVVFFGSQGLYCYDAAGTLLWRKDLGVLDVGAYDAPDYEWGTASSPIVYRDMVLVQCDTQKEDFLLALNVSTGETVWRAAREELPSWGTPTVYTGPGRAEIITNASNFIRGYDPASGRELWRLGGSSKITAPTPVYSGGLIVVASGRRPEAPIFVIRAGATGDISLPENRSESEAVVWSLRQRGSYMPTPLIYGEHLYVLANQGILDCYRLRTGEELYRKRLAHKGGGFSASPVAADGRIYLASEDGDIFVIRSGPGGDIEAANPMGERLMATPALASGGMFVRGERHLFAVAK